MQWNIGHILTTILQFFGANLDKVKIPIFEKMALSLNGSIF